MNVWTGTLATGQPAIAAGSGSQDDNSCVGWTDSGAGSSLAKGVLGTVYGTGGEWTSFTRAFCFNQYALYCFEQ